MFDIFSDVHGCFNELNQMFIKLGYVSDGLSYRHPEGRRAIFVGDLISRGTNSLAVIFLVRDMIIKGNAKSVIGNHSDKILRWAMGRNVTLCNGDEGTAREIENSKSISKREIIDFFSSLPYFLSLDDGKLIVAHAAYKPIQGVTSNFDIKHRTWSLYGPLKSHKPLPSGFPDRLDWASERVLDDNSPVIVCGHQPFDEVRITNKVYQIDTGCCFGGKLTSLSWPERNITQVSALRTYCEKIHT